ncbi:MAG: Release factor glutamine methyltransferase [Planctomycetota bacterium]
MAHETTPDHTRSGGSQAAPAPQRWTVRTLLAWMVPFLKEREVDNPRAISEILLAEVLKVERLRLYMEPDRELAAEELASLRGLVARAGRHEPVQFLVGIWPFLGRDFEVAPCTLIPRPCTEGLVESALDWYRERGAGGVRVLDLCTGTGCIAVSLALGMRAILRPEGAGCRPISAQREDDGAHKWQQNAARESRFEVDAGVAETGEAAPGSDPGAPPPAVASIEITATDIVPEAVELARRNARRHGVSIDFRCGDLWSALDQGERFDLIVSNPPYVTDEEYASLDRNVKEYEPASALRGGRDGLDLVRKVVGGAERHLNQAGLLAVEIGWKHRDGALALVSGRGWRDAAVLKDGDGIDRILIARRGAG